VTGKAWVTGEARVTGKAWVTGEARVDGVELGDSNEIRDDFFNVLSVVKNEIPFLVQSLNGGKVDGSVYEGECACLVGTIAKAKNCNYKTIEGLKPDSDRPAEQWFMSIYPGDTPKNSPVVKKTMEWIEEFQKVNS
jgi:hypothetical protein